MIKMELSPVITTTTHNSTLSNPGATHFVIFSDRKKNNADRMIQIATYFKV
ncbi:MAG: hypothetical protein ACSLE0_17775 [Chitinophagaceae bacterium]